MIILFGAVLAGLLTMLTMALLIREDRIREDLKVWRSAGVIFAVGWVLFGFVLLPVPLVGPLMGLELFLLPIAGVGTCLGLANSAGRRKLLPEVPIFGGTAVLIVGSMIASSPLVGPARYAQLIGEVEEVPDGELFVPTDVKHIRAVSPEQAAWAGNKVLGERDGSLGSQFAPGNYSIQLVENELVWVSPMDFLSFSRWQSSDGAPGYVKVSAEDPLKRPELVTDHKGKPLRFRYTPQAYFGFNLTRHVWQSGYSTYRMADYHLELDDSHRPFWVVSLTRPTIAYFGHQVCKVLLVDPETGAIQPFEVDETPAWVDRVIPEDIAVANITSFGFYSQGWWSAFWSGFGLKVPTTVNVDTDSEAETAWLIYGKDGRAHWFTGMTSTSTTDQALVSVMTMDSRTGKAREYRMSGPNETAVLSAATSAVSNFAGYHATQPILYKLSGELAWVVPILSEQHIFQKLAIVRANNAQVALADGKAGAVSALKNLIARNGTDKTSPSEMAQVTKGTITVRRIGDDFISGNLIRHIVADEFPGKVFTIQSSLSPRVPLIREGDTLLIQVIISDDEAIPVTAVEVVQ